MSVEAVAKSVAGSIFPSCTFSPEKVFFVLPHFLNFLLAKYFNHHDYEGREGFQSDGSPNCWICINGAFRS